MKWLLFLSVLLIFSCKRECACDCEKYRLERSIVAVNQSTMSVDSFTYYIYKKNAKDTLSDSLYKLFLVDRYADDSFLVLSTFDTFASVKKVNGITCAGTNQYYKDSFFCTCQDK